MLFNTVKMGLNDRDLREIYFASLILSPVIIVFGPLVLLFGLITGNSELVQAANLAMIALVISVIATPLIPFAYICGLIFG
jgi:hypothetical protein